MFVFHLLKRSTREILSSYIQFSDEPDFSKEDNFLTKVILDLPAGTTVSVRKPEMDAGETSIAYNDRDVLAEDDFGNDTTIHIKKQPPSVQPTVFVDDQISVRNNIRLIEVCEKMGPKLIRHPAYQANPRHVLNDTWYMHRSLRYGY